ncbi:MAG TPA: redoxin domain-containing protein, partial [Candidatus Marinimicrobia bacterium]|nr:redoxin domain-containing protein [Candidatus Neomarinimicrobiota bacterium]
MKIKISIFFILSAFLFAGDRGYIVEVGDMAPDFKMEFTDGQKTKLSELRGQIVILQFTASWCS